MFPYYGEGSGSDSASYSFGKTDFSQNTRFLPSTAVWSHFGECGELDASAEAQTQEKVVRGEGKSVGNNVEASASVPGHPTRVQSNSTSVDKSHKFLWGNESLLSEVQER